MPSQINTFIIGAQKAGTTSLYDWLGQHPNVDAPEEIKDYHFFSNEAQYKKGIKHLEGHFNPSEITLHGAVNYVHFADLCAPRLNTYNPDAKIIICIRNPVKRAISAYKYFIRTLRETNSFETAIQKEINGELKTFQEQSNNSYIEHGKYADQISSYLKHYDRSQIHIVFFEDLIDQTRQVTVLKETCAFLGINPDFKFEFTHLNASGQPKSKMYNYLARKSGITKLLRPFIPYNLRKKIGKKMEQKNISNTPIEVEIKQKDLDFLKDHFTKSNEDLGKLLDMDLAKIWK